MKRVVLITGSTGLLGSWLVRLLARRNQWEVIALVRATSDTQARNRLRASLLAHSDNDFAADVTKNVHVIRGDIREKWFGLGRKRALSLLDQITDVFHSAAVADFNVPLRLIRVSNVKGTRHVCEFAALGKKAMNRKIHVHHISTVAIGGSLCGWFGEGQFDCGQLFHNPYEQSKFEAERLVREYRNQGLHVTIYRPGIITGDSKNGVTTNFKMLYQPLHFLSLELFAEMPADRRRLLSLVPVDRVAEAISLLSSDDSDQSTWHLVNPYEVSIGELFDSAVQVLGCRKPVLVPVERFSRTRLTATQWHLIKPFIPYLNYKLRFKADFTNDRLKQLGFHWPRMTKSMLARLFQYCVTCGYVRAK